MEYRPLFLYPDYLYSVTPQAGPHSGTSVKTTYKKREQPLQSVTVATMMQNKNTENKNSEQKRGRKKEEKKNMQLCVHISVFAPAIV